MRVVSALSVAGCACVIMLMAAVGAGSPATSSPTPNDSQPTASAVPSSVASPGSVQSAAGPVSTASSIIERLTGEAPKPADSAADEQSEVLSLLAQTISWYRQLALERTLVVDPSETLFFDSDRQMAIEIGRFAFDYAKAASVFFANGTGTQSIAKGPPGAGDLQAKAAQAQAEVAEAKTRIVTLTAQMRQARGKARTILAGELASVQSELELEQSRVASFQEFAEFGKERLIPGTYAGDMGSQIEELGQGVPELYSPGGGQTPAQAAPETAARAAANVASASAESIKSQSFESTDHGLLGHINWILQLRRNQQALAERIRATQMLVDAVAALQPPLVARIQKVEQQADRLTAQAGTGDVAAIAQRKKDFQKLLDQHRELVAVIMPLAKQSVVLGQYIENLHRWNSAISEMVRGELRRVIIQVTLLAILLGSILGSAMVWRSLTFRYIRDPRRRRQLLQLRKLVVAIVIALVLIFDFTSELGSIATIMGFAAAGIALALQNVILSFAGYFFITGRFGIRVGDQIQLSGVSGEVIDVGLIKLTMMELGGENNYRQPTGRIAVFANSVVFQTNGNFFKQAPGSDFTWNEFSLTLAPDCDYRLVERRILELVEEVYARYRDQLLRQYREMERDLNLTLESPRPQSRLRIGESGIGMMIRYPAEIRQTVQVADEISRRLLDALDREPGLQLVVPGTPNLQRVNLPPASQPAAAAAAGESADSGNASNLKAAAAAVGAIAAEEAQGRASEKPKS